MRATFYENGYGIENDKVEDREVAYEWFTESYNHHTGVFPSEKQTHDFINGKRIVSTECGLYMEWELV